MIPASVRATIRDLDDAEDKMGLGVPRGLIGVVGEEKRGDPTGDMMVDCRDVAGKGEGWKIPTIS